MRIGVDVGGTNTDAVLMDGDVTLAELKRPTTADVGTGIREALLGVLTSAGQPAEAISAVMIGTTHFTNAVVEARRLTPTAVIRLARPATVGLPPMIDWPDRLKAAVGDHAYICSGGHEVDGRVIAPLDPGELNRVCEHIARSGVKAIAISSVFSPVNAEMELEAASLVQSALPDVPVSLSHRIGRIGLLERESATILNAALLELAGHTAAGFRAAVEDLAIRAPVFLSQNDGTLMDIETAARLPVATFASGPTNSMRGAALLSGEQDCLVVDVGGTTADIGMLRHGFPREASVAVDIGGVRTNFRMPDVLSIAVGGGTVIRGAGPDDLAVGPDSVGFALAQRALVFGGDTLTCSDVAVAAGRADFGERRRVAHLPPDFVRGVLRAIDERIAAALDAMKTSAAALPAVLVGGGSVLVAEQIAGCTRVVRPPRFAVANAVGAAIAQVSGETDRVVSLAHSSRARVIEAARDEAAERAVAAGALPASVQIVDVEETPLAYLPDRSVRLRVRAVGDLDLGAARAAAR